MKKSFSLICMALLFSCEAQDPVVPVSTVSSSVSQNLAMGPSLNLDTNLDLKLDLTLDVGLANEQLLELVPAQQQAYVISFNNSLSITNELSEMRAQASTFEQEILTSNLSGTDQQQLLELVAVVRGTADYLENGGVDEINAALAADLVKYGWLPADDPQVLHASAKTSRCRVNVRGVMAGAVVGFFAGGAQGGYIGATAGTVAFPVIGTVTGGVSGAAAGAAAGFFGGVISGVAAELLTSCWSVPRYTKRYEIEKGFDPDKDFITVLIEGPLQTD